LIKDLLLLTRSYLIKILTSSYEILPNKKELFLLTRSYQVKRLTFTYEILRDKKTYYSFGARKRKIEPRPGLLSLY